MSTAAETRARADVQATEAPERSEHCLACGAPLAGDQEWCLECGAARTVVHRPPDWRVGVAIMLGVVVVVLAVVLIVWP